ncbi:hypothetical protein [Fastidiosibacter lacustris]|uniref:hypothetical protein n=1 Tax=Fastidiosibacter lacustris TaxID=2056695 RepID=UPI000E357D64|nr:hypothetical protein [Fastidiosibacter lacustris]
MNFLYKSVEGLFAWLNAISNKTIYSYCELESADDENTLIAKDGSLISILEINGVKHMVGNDEYIYLCEKITAILTPLLQKQGVRIKCFFRYDAQSTAQEIDDLLLPSQKSAKRLNLNLDDYFEAKKEKLDEVCVFEKCYLCIWSSAGLLSAHAQKQAYRNKTERLKDQNVKISSKTQHFLHVLNEVRLQHAALLTMLLESFTAMGLSTHIMQVRHLLHTIKRQIAPDTTDKSWQPHLPGDNLYLGYEDKDWSNWLWPSLSYQLFCEDGANVNMSECVIGNYRYAPVTISLFPQHIQAFYVLFKTLKEYQLPWQMCFSLTGNGIKISQVKSLLAQFLTFSSHENKLICNAHKLLKHIQEHSDMPVVKLSVNLITWAPKSEIEEFQKRKAALNKAIQSWGSAQTTENFGDPFAIVQSTLLAINREGFPCAVGAPLGDAIKLMPFFRPAISWDYGATLFRTPDGKLWPYQSGSSKQVSWIELIYARSGSGKSVLLNSLNLSACLCQGLEELPYLSILDIGPSSKGVIDLLKSVTKTPNIAEHYQFTFSYNDAINPFDTHLGARVPGHAHKAFLINFLSALLLENVEASLPEGMEAMLNLVIDEVYKLHSDVYQPKLYQPGINPEIDDKINVFKSNDHGQSWWQVTDKLFEQNEIRLAQKAQRYAMPLLSDLISAVNQTSVIDLYKTLKLSNGESYIQYFCRNITTVIKNLPSLNLVTRLDVYAKVVAFDLSSVMSAVSASDSRISVIAYMLVRHLTASYFFVKAQDLESLANDYRHYHKHKLQELHNVPKRIVFDEFHRTRGCAPILRQVLTDMREGRKHNVQIALASQSLTDFNHTMLEFATSVFILSGGNQSALENTKSHFGLNETEALALKYAVHGPNSNGMNFIGQFHTINGVNTQLLNLSLSAYEVWLFTTTSEDCYLKEKLVEHLGVIPSLTLLARKFPQGSAKPYLETQAILHSDKSIKQIANELVETFIDQYYGSIKHA